MQETGMIKTRPTFAVLALGVALVLSGCGDREPDLREVRSTGSGPEEFGIVPNKPLEMPANFAQLPQPDPSGENRTAQRPLDDAIAVLGGAPARAQPSAGGGVPAGDAALVQQASRFGRDAGIRTTLATEDRAFRERRSLFSWQIVPSDRYMQAYRPQRLDPFDEVNRFRRAGVQTPAAPPRELAR
jgi:hypothetical protein